MKNNSAIKELIDVCMYDDINIGYESIEPGQLRRCCSLVAKSFFFEIITHNMRFQRIYGFFKNLD